MLLADARTGGSCKKRHSRRSPEHRQYVLLEFDLTGQSTLFRYDAQRSWQYLYSIKPLRDAVLSFEQGTSGSRTPVKPEVERSRRCTFSAGPFSKLIISRSPIATAFSAAVQV